MKIVLNDFIGVRGRSGSSRGASLISDVLAENAETLSVLRPKREPNGRFLRLCNMLSWDFLVVPARARLLDADVVVHATNTGIGFGKTKSVVVLHDTMVLDHPHLFNRYFVAYARVCMAVSVRFSDLIVTPSHHSRSRIEARWPRALVRVVPWPAYTNYGHETGHDDLAIPERPLSLDILIVSSMDKHKRLPLAIRAVEAARAASGKNFRVIFVSRDGNDSSAFNTARAEADPNGEWIIVQSGVDDADLTVLYRRAFCVMVSSLDEGFCLPALEGCESGVPVVHANRGALPEVIPRDECPAIHPEDDGADLEDQILKLLPEEHWRAVRDRGRRHARRFTKAEFAKNWAAALATLEPGA